MATQKGVIKLEGAVGDLSFYKKKGKYYARSKGGVSADRIKNDPAFVRTRENQQEFGRAGKAAKLLRTSLREVIMHCKDSGMSGRLTQRMMKIIQTDSENARGLRTVTYGDIFLLSGFEFNALAQLDHTMHMDYTVAIDRVSGTVTVTIPAFVPASMVVSPAGATHALIETGASEVDFEAGSFFSKTAQTSYFPLDYEEQAEIILTMALTANTEKLLFTALAFEFFQEVNGKMYPLNNGAYNALSLVKVDKNN